MADLRERVARALAKEDHPKGFEAYGTTEANSVPDYMAPADAAIAIVLEEAAKALCKHCAEGDVPRNHGEPFTMHHCHVEQGRFPRYSSCRAAAIRSLGKEQS